MIPASMQAKLHQIRLHQMLVIAAQAVAISASVLIAAMSISMLIDWYFVLLNSSLRASSTIASMVVAATTLIVLSRKPISDAWGFQQAAGIADTGVPQLEERWTTVTQSSADRKHHSSTYKALRVTVDAPQYVSRRQYEADHLPARLKAIEGSLLTLELRPDGFVSQIELGLSTVSHVDSQPSSKTVTLRASDDGVYRHQLTLLENLDVSPTLISHDGLSDGDDSVCRVQVLADQAPVARVISPTAETELNIDETVEIKFEAHDDYGIATAELVIYEVVPGEEPKIVSVEEIPLDDQRLSKHVVGTVNLDLKKFDLEKHPNLSYAIRVADNRGMTRDPMALAADISDEPMNKQEPGTIADGSQAEPQDPTSLAASTTDEPMDKQEPETIATGSQAASNAARKRQQEMQYEQVSQAEPDNEQSREQETEQLLAMLRAIAEGEIFPINNGTSCFPRWVMVCGRFVVGNPRKRIVRRSSSIKA